MRKYIVVDLVEMYTCPGHVDHKEFAERNGGADKVTSAGFIEDGLGGLKCVGESHSLGIGSRERDTLLLGITLNAGRGSRV